MPSFRSSGSTLFRSRLVHVIDPKKNSTTREKSSLCFVTTGNWPIQSQDLIREYTYFSRSLSLIFSSPVNPEFKRSSSGYNSLGLVLPFELYSYLDTDRKPPVPTLTVPGNFPARWLCNTVPKSDRGQRRRDVNIRNKTREGLSKEVKNRIELSYSDGDRGSKSTVSRWVSRIVLQPSIKD